MLSGCRQLMSLTKDVPLPFGTARSENTYRLRDVVSREGRRVAVIEVAGTTGPVELDTASPMAGMMELSGSQTTGTVEFDADRGVLLAMSMTSIMEATAMGTAMQVETTHRTELLEE